MAELMQASKQWATRPDDQRFLTLSDLKDSVAKRRSESWTVEHSIPKMFVVADEPNNDIFLSVNNPVTGDRSQLELNNWSFNQLSQYAGAPASYLRKLPAMLSAINLQYGIERMPMRENGLVLAQTNGSNVLRAITSTNYGRIWDLDVVDAVERVNVNGNWKVPSASYATNNPKRATTLYASDRDVFIFLVDDSHPIEVNGETLFRGFMTWNSEVGSAVFGLTTFLYRYVCDNRIIWGATDVRELRIRHTGGAPERFAYEGARYLQRYAEEATYKVIETVKKADAFELKNQTWNDWLKQRGFTKAQSDGIVNTAKAEEGEARSLWDIVNGATAMARSIAHTDTRVQFETQAGNLLRFVSDN